MGKKKNNFRKGFRKNTRIKHPTYLVDKDGNFYKYIGVTHSKTYQGVDNVPLRKNPNPNDTAKAYIRPIVEKDSPQNFGRTLKGWKFSSEDKKTVDKIIKKSKSDK